MELDAALDAFAELERRASVLYSDLSWAFRSPPELHLFWRDLANAEGDHAHMLNLAGQFVRAQGLKKEVPIDPQLVPRMVRHFEDYRRRIAERPSLEAALSLALDLEQSELDEVFLQLLSASPGVRPEELEYFRTEAREHYDRLAAAIEQWCEDKALKARAQSLRRAVGSPPAARVGPR